MARQPEPVGVKAFLWSERNELLNVHKEQAQLVENHARAANDSLRVLHLQAHLIQKACLLTPARSTTPQMQFCLQCVQSGSQPPTQLLRMGI